VTRAPLARFPGDGDAPSTAKLEHPSSRRIRSARNTVFACTPKTAPYRVPEGDARPAGRRRSLCRDGSRRLPDHGRPWCRSVELDIAHGDIHSSTI